MRNAEKIGGRYVKSPKSRRVFKFQFATSLEPVWTLDKCYCCAVPNEVIPAAKSFAKTNKKVLGLCQNRPTCMRSSHVLVFHLGQAVAVCIALNSLFALFGCEVLTFVAQLYFAGGLADDFECSAKDCVHGCWILSFQASLAQKIKGLLN